MALHKSITENKLSCLNNINTFNKYNAHKMRNIPICLTIFTVENLNMKKNSSALLPCLSWLSWYSKPM